MKKLTNEIARVIMVLFLCVGGSFSFAESEVIVTVKSQPQSDGKYFFTYSINNNSNKTITSFSVGEEYGKEESELDVDPTGWNLETGLPSSSVTSPQSWTPELMLTEESNYSNLQWHSGDESADLKPGQSVSGFGVLVPQYSDAYVKGHWTVIFNNATALTGVLTVSTQP